MNFKSELIKNKETWFTVFGGRTEPSDILDAPEKSIVYKAKFITTDKINCVITVKYAIMFERKASKEIFVGTVTESIFEISDNANKGFGLSIELENELKDISLIAIEYNALRLKEKLVDTEIPDYGVIKFTDGFIRTTIRQHFVLEN